ncbi:hypothetical protein NIES2100_18860 [Calothrix sp. NIES-2100]|uniref:hypothetical protein n=1 Tax=Calothrix sp. NIES-2100 TaxID=1954172 RepID=UPI000B602174|nr:hypothetical protein NIES2100_18860 [Calothrix sp. NIES-2100]
MNLAKFWDNLTAAPALFNGLLLYSSEQGGAYAVLRGSNYNQRQKTVPMNRRGLALLNPKARIYLPSTQLSMRHTNSNNVCDT